METKRCPKCENVLPVDAFSKNKSNKDGLQGYCKACMKDVVHTRKDKNCNVVWDLESLKVCTVCNNSKPLYEFYFNYNEPKSECKECAAKAKSEYYQANKSSILARSKKYNQDNKEYRNAYAKEYYATNRDRILEQKREYSKHPEVAARKSVYNRQYTLANLDKLIAYRKVYNKDHYLANKEYYRHKGRLRRARLRKAKGIYHQEDIDSLKVVQQNRCVYCGSSLDEGFQVDHYMPLILGGSNWPSNLQLLCETCNKRKWAKLPEVFEAEIGFDRAFWEQNVRRTAAIT